MSLKRREIPLRGGRIRTPPNKPAAYGFEEQSFNRLILLYFYHVESTALLFFIFGFV
jgi:hypothetical protein